jgi:peroxiredoxin Q/BCP
MIQVGKKAPDFTLLDQDGTEHKLSQYKGSKVLLYFYPKDDTPGCTTEACNFRDGYKDFKKMGLVILGVSKDNVKSHKKFADKFKLPFPLLADTEHIVAEKYDVWKLKKFMGREYMGMERSSFLIDEEGKIAKVYETVKPADHSVEVKGDIKAKK